jgi:hypothetical protein
LAEQLREFLAGRFHIAIRVRTVAGGAAYRLYQVRTPKNRHLVAVRYVAELPPCNRLQQILVLAAPELVAHKVISMVSRSKTPKGLIDGADLRRLLLSFPELRTEEGPVLRILTAMAAPQRALDAWRQLLQEDIVPDDDDEGF